MITITVVYPSGKPVQGSRVCLGFSMGFTEEILTDEYGEATFGGVESGRTGSVYIDGQEVFSDRPIPSSKTFEL
ncbi:MAG: hypothetical protein A2051_06175 [Desulfovibrionales bacterium GWA2_65_9]|nr:MAG: hypothetical protein A2051_06175 [Desulfovibrionales bacterium GWA2_65_9]